ncbi:hypothetical protein GUJ93_ZPchr0007g4566 [Zizania palustris]|uniref:Uncharacterized protein n=1 Tax=Zizania palustris TaxID=103762 RepID=A0A8J5TEU2_ZIZPA|nr:hypothetical protein GUJ93_ZPchr0007g4566 [Zizania palustris]
MNVEALKKMNKNKKLVKKLAKTYMLSLASEATLQIPHFLDLAKSNIGAHQESLESKALWYGGEANFPECANERELPCVSFEEDWQNVITIFFKCEMPVPEEHNGKGVSVF